MEVKVNMDVFVGKHKYDMLILIFLFLNFDIFDAYMKTSNPRYMNHVILILLKAYSNSSND